MRVLVIVSLIITGDVGQRGLQYGGRCVIIVEVVIEIIISIVRIVDEHLIGVGA